jgi:DNA-binding MarR family transcriptional regulator
MGERGATSPRRRLVYQVNVARHCMMKYLDAGCRARLDISVTQLSALMVLGEHNGCLMKDLAETLMLDKSAVTGLARRMQSAGLITKTVSKKDSRATVLAMTDKGQTLLREGSGELVEVNAMMSEGFTEAELDTVARFLTHLTRVFADPTRTAKAG